MPTKKMMRIPGLVPIWVCLKMRYMSKVMRIKIVKMMFNQRIYQGYPIFRQIPSTYVVFIQMWCVSWIFSIQQLLGYEWFQCKQHPYHVFPVMVSLGNRNHAAPFSLSHAAGLSDGALEKISDN